MTHFGSRATGKTACGKPLARRWWVERKTVEHGAIGRLGVYRIVMGESDCPKCTKARKR